MAELTTLQALELALLDQQAADVRAFFDAADLVSCNESLMDAGEHYRFPTFVSDNAPINGQTIMLARDLAKLMYDTTDTSGIGQLLRTYGYEFLTLRGCEDHLRSLLVQHFHLSKFNTKAGFATWQHLLIVGMYGQTEQARKVKAYLLKREKASRIADKVEESTGMSPRQLVTSRGDLLVQMAEAYRVQEQRLLEVEAEQAAQQQQLIIHQAAMIETQHQALEALTSSARAEAKADQSYHNQNFWTVAEYVQYHGLRHQCPESAHVEASRHMQAYCKRERLNFRDPNILPRRIPVGDKNWETEWGFHTSIYEAAFLPWLLRRQSQVPLHLIHTQGDA